MRANFDAWLKSADLPRQLDDGTWIDDETGIHYDDDFDYAGNRESIRTSLNKKSLDARAVAKKLGGKALAGSKRQKEWAEKIRAEKLDQMTEQQGILACDKNGLLNHAKFWIENREKSGKEIGTFIETQKRLLRQSHELKTVDKNKYLEIVNEYNNLTTVWFPYI